jgi:hypothetical protein
MFHVFEEHESSTKGHNKLHPEQQIVQYVLPCFVASFLEFADHTDVEQKDKETFVKIVHELIKGYEVDPYKVAYMEGPFSGGFSPYLLVNGLLYYVVHWRTQLVFDGLQRALGSSPKATNLVKTLDSKFFAVLLDQNNPLLELDPTGSHRLHRIWGMWRVLVCRLLARIANAIQKAVPGCLPNLKALEMTLIANMLFVDHTPPIYAANVSIYHGRVRFFNQI